MTETHNVERITLPMTDARPVRLSVAAWPIVARADWSHHDGEIWEQATRRWDASIVVRQHADGRVVVSGDYYYRSQFRDDEGAEVRVGEMDREPGRVLRLVATVADTLAARGLPAARAAQLQAEVLADLPPVDLDGDPSTPADGGAV
jgi:hypothetical protein